LFLLYVQNKFFCHKKIWGSAPPLVTGLSRGTKKVKGHWSTGLYVQGSHRLKQRQSKNKR